VEFAEPLLGTGGRVPSKERLETVLKVAFSIWNSAVLDAIHGNSHNTNELRLCLEGTVLPAALIEQMLSRKRTMFGNDLRMVGNYGIVKKDGEWRLWVEARNPFTEL
jgi:hypothetical protein